jgi:AcrR family transcriptional regulator
MVNVSGNKPRTKPSARAGSQDGRHARGRATHELILIAAERLFAERGIAAVSLRDVGAAAGQKNNAAVQYHFGDKENLVREVAVYRLKFTDAVCIGIITKLRSDRKPPQVVDYVDAFVVAVASNLVEGNYFIPFLSRYIIERGVITLIQDASPATTVAIFKDIWHQLLPQFSGTIIEERWQVLITSVVHTLASYQTAYKSGTLSAPLKHLLQDLVQFHAAGLQAPPRSTQKPRRARL